MALPGSSQLSGSFFVRFPFRLWTSRRYINGVIAAAEDLIGDAILEYVIEGVMDDIKVFLDANEVVHSTWTDITLAPRAIRRATTYGAVASLYARRTKTFQARVVPTVFPVKAVVVGDAERAMEHWTDKTKEMLDLYIATQISDRMWVSTADEEPIFSMEDIPPEVTADLSWHQWLAQRDT